MVKTASYAFANPPRDFFGELVSARSVRQEGRRQNSKHTKGGDVPKQRADQRYPGYVKGGVGDAPAKIGDRSPMSELVVNARDVSDEDRRCKEWKRLHIVSEISVDAAGDGF